ncbi:MAG TPA: 50S ribosomal protein L11 methyltransferase [Actinomycetota bacterium]|nr:50S ribosomal protein L11 methyltransferase [Actinomycetota bacterium]
MESTDREYTWQGRGGPFTLLLGGNVFVPTRTSFEVADGLTINPGETVIDVGCGSGVLSFVAARLGAGKVYGTEVNPESVEFARRNAERLGLADRVEVREGNLFEPLSGVLADVVIGDVAGIPDDIAAMTDWYPGGFSGGPTGAEVPVAMLEASGPFLRPGGRLYLPTGSIQDEGAVLRAARRIFGEGRMRQLRERIFPLPAKLGESPVVRRLMDSGVVNFIRRGSRLLWELRVWECIAPPASAARP